MKFREGTGKTGKPYQGWFCTNKECEDPTTGKPHVEWVHSDKIFDKTEKKFFGVKDDVFQGTKSQEKPHTAPKSTTSNDMSKEEWAKKEKRDHKRALTMQAFSLFPPMTDETEGMAMDRWLKVKDLRDIMLLDLYCD